MELSSLMSLSDTGAVALRRPAKTILPFWERLTVNIGIVLISAAFLLQIPETSMTRRTVAVVALTLVDGSFQALTYFRQNDFGPFQVSALTPLRARSVDAAQRLHLVTAASRNTDG